MRICRPFILTWNLRFAHQKFTKTNNVCECDWITGRRTLIELYSENLMEFLIKQLNLANDTKDTRENQCANQTLLQKEISWLLCEKLKFNDDFQSDLLKSETYYIFICESIFGTIFPFSLVLSSNSRRDKTSVAGEFQTHIVIKIGFFYNITMNRWTHVKRVKKRVIVSTVWALILCVVDWNAAYFGSNVT